MAYWKQIWSKHAMALRMSSPLQIQGTQDSPAWSKMAPASSNANTAIMKPQISRDTRGSDFPLPGSLFLVTPVMFYWHEYFGGCHHLLGNCISDLSSPGTLSIYLHLQWVPRQTLRLPEVELLHLKKDAEQWLAAAMQMNTDLQGKYHYLVHREINVLGAKKENMAVMLGNSFPSLFRKLGSREAVPHFGILIWDFEMFYIILCLY